MSSSAPRPAEARRSDAERLLRERGFVGARVEIRGPEGEIAALCLPAADFDRSLGAEGAALAAAVRALGFRYVALDLQPLG